MTVRLSSPIAIIPYIRGDGVNLSAEIYYSDGPIPDKLGAGFGTPNQSLFYIVRNWYNYPQLYQTLLDELEWSKTYVKLYDKVIPSPRLVHFCGDVEEGRSRFHTYSSYSHQIQKWQPNCEWIRDAIHFELGMRYNSCLLNYYQNGSDYIAYHGDKEVNDYLQSVATVSLGSTRRFYLQSNSTKEIIKVELHSGDLVIMTGNLQQTHKHSVPKQAGVGGRISITYRIL